MFNRREGVATNAHDISRAELDEGLRAYMLRVYSYMAFGLALTGAVGFYVVTNAALMQTLLGTPLRWVFLAIWIGMGFFSNRLFFSNNPVVGQVAFWGFCVVGGVLVAGMVAPFMYGYGGGLTTVARAFMVTAVTFLGMSILGYTTKRDLSGFGGFFAMAIIGIFVAMLANAFIFESSSFGLIISCVVVLVFSALLMYETQQIKHMYFQGMSMGMQNQTAIFGAYLLYGSFIVLFSHILNILGALSGD
ncbi:MAG: Bax inhibitor-1/YccA family protein [Alphaproteobacteria bacterium]